MAEERWLKFVDDAETTTTVEEQATTEQETQAEGTEESNTQPEGEVAPVEEQEAESATEVQSQEEVKPEPKKINIKDFVDTHKEDFLKYLTESTRDYSSYDNLEAVKLELKAKNPAWDDKDIEGELQEKYGIGLKLHEINEDELTEDEVKELKKENKLIQDKINKGERLLKKDGLDAKSFLSSTKEEVSLPEFEFLQEAATQQVEPIDQDKFIEEAINKAKEHNEKVWIPALESTLQQVNTISEKVEVELDGNKVVLDLDYNLNENDKKEVLNFLSGYVATDSDNAKYVNEKGEPDLQRFVADKTKELHFKKLIETAVKQTAVKVKKDVYKKEIVNYSEEVRDTLPILGSDEDDLLKFVFNKKKAN